MQLLELQRAFWSAVRTRGAPPEGLGDWLTRSAKQTATERLAVYHRAYWGRQVAALTATFPRVQALLGPASCERLLLAYIEAQPGVDPCIERLGAGLADFLASRKDVSATVQGVARLEWASVESLLSPDPEQVAELPRHLGLKFADCRLKFVPSLRLVHVPGTTLSAFAPDRPEVTTGDAGGATGRPSANVDVAFFRPQFKVMELTLSADEAQAHALASGGGTVAVICSAFAALSAEEAAPHALAVLSNWFARGWVARCEP